MLGEIARANTSRPPLTPRRKTAHKAARKGAPNATSYRCRQRRRRNRGCSSPRWRSAAKRKERIMAKQRISYIPLEKMDPAMREEMHRCEREGTPRPESSAVRAHVPACFWFFANSWRDIFRNGVLDHAIKELCRLYVSRSVVCEYCGNQRSVKATTSGA